MKRRIKYFKERNDRNILVDKYGLIYFKQHKVASTTFLIQFAELLSIPQIESDWRSIHYPKIYPFPTASKEEILTKYQDFVRFAIVRNPWERLVSLYKDKVTGEKERNEWFFRHNPQLYHKMPFAEFIERVAETPDSDSDVHFVQQLYFLHDAEGNFLLNYFGDLANLGKHLEEIKAKTGILFKKLPQRNATKKSSYQTFYTPDLVEKVRQRFAMDIDFFEYEFGDENNRFPFGFLPQEKIKELNTPEFRTAILQEKMKDLRATSEVIFEDYEDNEKRLEDIHERKMKDIKDSFSWRITAPLRAVSNLLRGSQNRDTV